MRDPKMSWPLLFVAGHTVSVFFYFTWDVVYLDSMNEGGWEYTFGLINFPMYYLIGVPQCVVEHFGIKGSVYYALWFAGIGAIQWAVLGFIVSLVRRAMRE
jgi:hypothetical protein